MHPHPHPLTRPLQMQPRPLAAGFGSSLSIQSKNIFRRATTLAATRRPSLLGATVDGFGVVPTLGTSAEPQRRIDFHQVKWSPMDTAAHELAVRAPLNSKSLRAACCGSGEVCASDSPSGDRLHFQIAGLCSKVSVNLGLLYRVL